MGPDPRQRDRPSCQGAADQGQAGQPLCVHRYPAGEAEVHDGTGREGGRARVE